MATKVLMPRQGNTVESCVILEWKKKEGDSVEEGEIICEVETDKAAFEVEAPASGTLIKTFFDEGDDVPVLTVIAAIGEPGEDVSGLAPGAEGGPEEEEKEAAPEPDTAGKEEDAAPAQAAEAAPRAEAKTGPAQGQPPPTAPPGNGRGGKVAASPRARRLAEAKGIDYKSIGGSGPEGRVIERDVQYVLGTKEPLTPAAIEKQLQLEAGAPASGQGIGGRVTAGDIYAAASAPSGTAGLEFPGPAAEEEIKGVRKLIAERMKSALHSTAQLTMHTSADARTILAYRKKLKTMPEESGFTKISLNDFILYAASRSLLAHPNLNAHFLGDKVKRFSQVHLGMAVDTPRGLMVPVIRNAHALSLRQISSEAKRLAKACIEGGINPDELSGATFTVTNLGAFGIEGFTPIANAPEVGILGVNTIEQKASAKDGTGTVEFVPRLGFSLTVDHQFVDGADGARFLQGLTEIIEKFDVFLAG